ncbi:RNA-binding domain-containing protein [Xylariaceae sp. FL0594]|nr:RNA-binding domain-containing protein [Xylariaceae sp. FL0594]
MHSIRRAVLRAAWSSPRAIAAPRQISSVVSRVSRPSVQSASASPLSRYFTQTAFVSNEAEESTPASSQAFSEEKTRKEGQDGCGLFIANMSYDASTEHLMEAFSKYGQITHASVAKDTRGLSRGFGFVTFDNKASAERAIADADNSYWHGRRIVVKLRESNLAPRPKSDRGDRGGREPRTPREPSNSVYVGNIPYETTDAELNKMFRNLENVVDVRVAVDRNTGWPRGFAHADFMDVESATKAVEYLSKQQLGGRTLRVDYSQPRTLNRREQDRREPAEKENAQEE